MYTLFLSALIVAAWYFRLPTWWLLVPLWLLALVLLLPHTWEDFLAAMNFKRVSVGWLEWPKNRDEVGNEPEAAFVANRVILPPALLRNWCLMNLAAFFYFATVPRYTKEFGLTMLLNRLVAEEPPDSWRHRRAKSVQKRWLGRYDHRGFHA